VLPRGKRSHLKLLTEKKNDDDAYKKEVILLELKLLAASVSCFLTLLGTPEGWCGPCESHQ